MIQNGITYNKLIRNGIIYNKAFLNGAQVFGDPSLILDIPFQNSIANTVSSVSTIVAGGLPTYVAGRKGNDFCAVFNGSKSVKTAVNLPLNSDKVSFSFWIKTTSTAVSCIFELGANSSLNDLGGFINTPNVSRMSLRNGGTANSVISSLNINTNAWFHIAMVIDRSVATNQTSIFINGLKSDTVVAATQMSGNFINNIFYIGQRTGTALGLTAQIQEFKLWNRVLTQQEVTDLYNS